MRIPKKCLRCKKPVDAYTTDGKNIYVKGEKMPDEMIKAWFPCPYCKGSVVWVKERNDEAKLKAMGVSR